MRTCLQITWLCESYGNPKYNTSCAFPISLFCVFSNGVVLVSFPWPSFMIQLELDFPYFLALPPSTAAAAKSNRIVITFLWLAYSSAGNSLAKLTLSPMWNQSIYKYTNYIIIRIIIVLLLSIIINSHAVKSYKHVYVCVYRESKRRFVLALELRVEFSFGCQSIFATCYWFRMDLWFIIILIIITSWNQNNYNIFSLFLTNKRTCGWWKLGASSIISI